MPSPRSRGPRLALAGAAVLTVLTLTACEPEDGSTDPASGAPTAAAPASASATAAPAPTTAPAKSPAAATGSPAGKRTVVEAQRAGSLQRYTGAGAVSDVPVDPGEMRDGMHLVVAEYAKSGQATGRRTLVVAVDNVPEDPNKRREHLWRGLIDYALQHGSTGTPTTATPYAPGPLGGSLECLSLPASASATDVLCGWADASTAAVALFPATTPDAAARDFAAMRADLEH
ncbi:hypothetical protein [Kitasatospora camelliae]|uniref:Lipoprotein n=1 Tax=Kitasatospora camelliae TaxID=3156397 RepID=A0AAU8JU01_9ACTN